ncbi:MAG TPA: lipid biosynthesis B12-binding/radical SAM protein [Chitinispirillaceae bacterium]|nr:lipid biosynthesis B12-binding/radical SAM protein [Chitinispirillaceae bacterium]
MIKDTKILLISLNRYDQPYKVFPLGMSYIAAALQKCGCEVIMADCNYDFERIENIVIQHQPDCVGISIRNIDDVRIENNTFFVPELERLVQRLKTVTDVPFVIGGSAYSLFPERLLEITGIEFGITGEGEQAFVSLAECIGSGDLDVARLEKIPGLVYRKGGRIVRNLPQTIDPGNIVQPLRSPGMLEYYIKESSVVNIQTQRGCPYTCCYCTYPLIEGRTVRQRSAGNVVDEIEQVIAAGADYLFIVDSVFNISNDHVATICEEILKRKITCQWSCYLRPKGLTSELMKLMKQAGLSHIEFGSDSLCDSVLDAYGKNFTFNDIYESSEFAREHRVHYAHFLISGGPGETEATLIEGFENSKKLRKTVFFPFVGMRIFPGTVLFSKAIQDGLIGGQQDFLAPVFYLSPSLDQVRIRKLHEEFKAQMPNWVIDDVSPEVRFVMDGLRKKGVRGPLWEFLAR